MSDEPSPQLIVALDFRTLSAAYDLAQQLVCLVGMFKIGSQLFTSEGPHAVEKIGSLGPGIFLDLKFHDIPKVVASAVSAAASLSGVRLMTVHALGGLEMMRAASASLPTGRGKTGRRPRLLAVTVLTSLDSTAMRQVGLSARVSLQAAKLAQMANQAGLDGVVASAREAASIRRACGKDFLIVVPGVRPGGPGAMAKGDDQARVATPGEAIRAGADYIVVGRPITAARDARAAAAAILEEIAQAQHAQHRRI